MKVAFETLGCKANWADTESLLQSLAVSGIEIVEAEDIADVYIVNTCTVTNVAASQSRNMLRRMKRRSKKATVIATGCVGEVSADLLNIPEVDKVFGTSDRKELLEYVFQLAGISNGGFSLPVKKQSRARAFLKVQDGCERHCAYCVVPTARGKCKSLPVVRVVEACRELSKHHREIIITGVDISQYGCDLGDTTLLDLVETLSTEKDISRIRLTSVHPTVVSEKFAEIISDVKRFCRHVHLSIQSASDNVLREMGRGYSTRELLSAINILRSKIDGIALTGDIIAGFPSETAADHVATCDLLSASGMAGLHVFPFSPICGTRAFEMKGRVPEKTVKTRAAELRKIAGALRKKYLSDMVGRTFEVIVTSKLDIDGRVEAFSDNGISLSLPANKIKYAELAKARVSEVKGSEVFAEWL